MLNLDDILVCPTNKKPLKKNGNEYKFGNHEYPIKNAVPIFLTEDLNEVKQVETETYSHRAKDFDEDKILHMGRPNFTAPLRAQGKDALLLEIACGNAAHGLNMLKDGYKVIESDIALGTVERVKGFAQKLKVDKNASFMVIDAEYLPFKNETLGAVSMIASLHHIPNPAKALKEFYRCLKPGGVVLIGYEPSNWQYVLFAPLYWLLRKIIRSRHKGRPISLADDHTFGFSKRKLARLLKDAGFKVRRISPVHFTYKAYQNWLILWSKLLKKNFKERVGIKKMLLAIDKVLAKIPLLRGLTWDWDALGEK